MIHIPSDHYSIQTSNGEVIYGFYNSPIGGFYIKFGSIELEKMDLSAFCTSLIGLDSPEVMKAIKEKRLEFKNDEFLNQLYSRLNGKK